MAQTFLRDKARNMRSAGASLNDIAQCLKLQKSTIRYWCRDIVLSEVQQRRLFQKQKLGGIHAAEKMRKRRLYLINELMNEGVRKVGNISQRELLLIGAALYWAEGYRKGDGEFGFTNSDPKMIRLMTRWLQDACGIDKSRIHMRVCLNILHKKRMREIKKFWIKVTQIPSSQFAKPTLINVRNKKVYLNQTDYFGTLRIKVRQSTNLRRKILGLIEGLSHRADY